MSTRRFLWALACICTSAGAAAAGGSVAELEVKLAQTPALYLRLDVTSRELQVKVRGMELERFPVDGVRLVVRRAPGEISEPLVDLLPAVWKVVGDPELEWRAVVAPPTLVPYDENAEPPTPTSESVRKAPAQISAFLDNGWSLHLGPDPPTGWWRRIADRLGSGWRRLWGKAPAVPPPALVVELQPDDSRALLHIVRDGIPLLVVCGEPIPAAGAQAARSTDNHQL